MTAGKWLKKLINKKHPDGFVFFHLFSLLFDRFFFIFALVFAGFGLSVSDRFWPSISRPSFSIETKSVWGGRGRGRVGEGRAVA